MARKYHQGKYKIKNPEKYIGDPRKIIFRSSWELKMFIWADGNDKVLKWGSEEVVVPYVSPFDNRIHRYFTDMYVEKIEDGKVVKHLWEVKPETERHPPKKPKRMTKSYVQRLKTYVINQAKWKAAYKYSEERGIKFSVLTEYQIGIK